MKSLLQYRQCVKLIVIELCSVDQVHRSQVAKAWEKVN